MDFVPLFGMALGAALRSLTYGRLLHKSFFEAKRMSPFQIELWITERQSAYRSFGFVAALMERVPLIGLVFSISNRIGAAMWAHDLEKRQQRIRASTLASSSSSSITSGTEVKGLEEFSSKPTLKKIYKNVQQDAANHAVSLRTVEDDDGNFNGEGLAVVRFARGQGVFTHLSFTFPLKLISPAISSRNATRDALQRPQVRACNTRVSSTTDEGEKARAGEDGDGWIGAKAVSALYVVGYGGGLVSGDSVDLDIDVGSQCCLLLLTQGSTKVFKTRTSRPTQGVSTATFSSTLASHTQRAQSLDDGQLSMTRQNFRFLVRKHSTLVLLPDAVTCFARARYDQVQRFDLRDHTSSCVVLDWITPGRTAVGSGSSASNPKLDHLDSHSSHTGTMLKDYSTPARDAELWQFSHYRSRNDVRVSKHVVARDTILLSQTEEHEFVDPITGLRFTELARRNHPYGCYATLILAGPDAAEIIHSLETEFHRVQQRPTTWLAHDALWSLSRLEHNVVIVRIAANDAQSVRRWLHSRLTPLQNLIGSDLYRQALA